MPCIPARVDAGDGPLPEDPAKRAFDGPGIAALTHFSPFLQSNPSMLNEVGVLRMSPMYRASPKMQVSSTQRPELLALCLSLAVIGRRDYAGHCR